jgi:hypothetical protein
MTLSARRRGRIVDLVPGAIAHQVLEYLGGFLSAECRQATHGDGVYPPITPPRALSGGQDRLGRDNSPVLVLEFHPATLVYSGHNPDHLIGLLASYGYVFYPHRRLQCAHARPIHERDRREARTHRAIPGPAALATAATFGLGPDLLEDLHLRSPSVT